MKFLKWLRPISQSTQPDVAALQISNWQDAKQVKLASELRDLLLRHKAAGLAPRGIMKVLSGVTRDFDKLAA